MSADRPGLHDRMHCARCGVPDSVEAGGNGLCWDCNAEDRRQFHTVAVLTRYDHVGTTAARRLTMTEARRAGRG